MTAKIKKINRYAIYLIIAITAIVSTRGFLTDHQLAGHDRAAYYITQHQFHKNIIAGCLFPRWAPDMRYGYGHPKLQFRPPLLHYLAEPAYALTANPALSLNLAVVILVFIAGFGMFLCCRTYMKAPAAMIGAVAYITFNYLLADLYIRGAYYEVAAYAFMPWILWSQATVFRKKSENSTISKCAIVVCGFAWSGLICSHPQIMTFFIPLALIHFFFLWNETRNSKAAMFAIIATVAGFMIAAPYWYVAMRELPFVRMELFYTGLEAYPRHFISFKELIFENWPDNYHEFAYTDYLNRPRHMEMRSLNIWALFILSIVPVMWLLRNYPLLHSCRYISVAQKSQFNRISTLFYLSFLGLIILALPISRGVWLAVTPLHTFNFPWRVLAVTGICLAVLTGLTADELRKYFNIPADKLFLPCLLIAVFFIIPTWHKSSGWKPQQNQSIGRLTDKTIQASPGIPKQFYTPKWCSFYSNSSSPVSIRFISGQGNAEIINREATEWKLKINTKTNAEFAIAHYYYPGWKMFTKNNYEIKIEPLPETGEITFNLSPGNYDLILKFTNTSERSFANILAVMGVIILCFSSFGLFSHKKTKNVTV